MTMDGLSTRPDHDPTLLPEIRTELRWRDAELWPVRRPYPVEVPCPACGTHTRCDFFGRQRCPHGHEFGQRAFWNGGATSCWLLLEDLRDGRLAIHAHAALSWSDDARRIRQEP